MSTKKPEQEPEAAEDAQLPARVTLRRGEDTVEVTSPTLVTKLKSQGWEAVQ